MKLASEEAVTKLLSSKEILQIRDKFFISNPISFDLGNFLKKIPSNIRSESRFGSKYVFIK